MWYPKFFEVLFPPFVPPPMPDLPLELTDAECHQMEVELAAMLASCSSHSQRVWMERFQEVKRKRK